MSKARDIASAAPAPSTVSATELGYLDGVTSAIQTQLDAKTAKSTLTTTGDIYYASSANTPARLAIGSTSDVLTVVAGVPGWAAPAGGGKVLQVVQGTTTTNASNSTTTFADTNLSASITPSAATSKILVLVSQHCEKTNGHAGNTIALRLMRGATEVYINQYLIYTNSTLVQRGLQSFNYLDSPSTTSATTYKTQFANDVNQAAVAVQASNQIGTIILMEIGA
jgi:hypothetical protein